MFKETFYLVLLTLLILMIGNTKKNYNPISMQFDDACAIIGMWIIIIGFYMLTLKYKQNINETDNFKQVNANRL